VKSISLKYLGPGYVDSNGARCIRKTRPALQRTR